MRVDRVDYIPVQKSQVNQGGILAGTGIFARAGCQTYYDSEGNEIVEFRPPSEVRKSSPTFRDLGVTLNHPPEPVKDDNVDKYLCGVTGSTSYIESKKVIRGEVKIFSRDAKALCQGSHRYLSCGYSCEIENTPGEWRDDWGVQGPVGKTYRYDCIQRNIKGNHLALVESPRAGQVAKLDGERIAYADDKVYNKDDEIRWDSTMGYSVVFDNEEFQIDASNQEKADRIQKALESGKLIQDSNYSTDNLKSLLELGSKARQLGIDSPQRLDSLKNDTIGNQVYQKERQARIDAEEKNKTLNDEVEKLRKNQENFNEKVQENAKTLFDSVLREYEEALPYLPDGFQLKPGVSPGDIYKTAIKTHLPKVEIDDSTEQQLKFQFQVLQSVKPVESLQTQDNQSSEQKEEAKKEDSARSNEDYQRAQEQLNTATEEAQQRSEYVPQNLPQQRPAAFSV